MGKRKEEFQLCWTYESFHFPQMFQLHFFLSTGNSAQETGDCQEPEDHVSTWSENRTSWLVGFQVARPGYWSQCQRWEFKSLANTSREDFAKQLFSFLGPVGHIIWWRIGEAGPLDPRERLHMTRDCIIGTLFNLNSPFHLPSCNISCPTRPMIKYKYFAWLSIYDIFPCLSILVNSSVPVLGL